MHNYRRRKFNEEKKVKEQSDEEKEKIENSQTPSAKSSNNSSPSPVKRYRYRRFYTKRKKEQEQEENNNDNNESKDANNENENYQKKENTIVPKSIKEDILKKLSEVVPIIEDKEGEDNITPNKKKKGGIDIDGRSLINDMLKNEFQNENEDNSNMKIRKSINGDLNKYKKYYDNELIDAILDVEKYNVDTYLSNDLAAIYNDINKDNLFFKNDVFLGNIDNFEKKTGNLDKKKNTKKYNSDINIQKEIPKTNELINRFTENLKFFG